MNRPTAQDARSLIGQRLSDLAPDLVAPSRFPPGMTPLEYVLTEAYEQARKSTAADGDPLRVAITNLCHAVYRAHTENDPLPSRRVLEITRKITAAGGGFS